MVTCVRLLALRYRRPTALVIPTPSVDAALAGFRARHDSSAPAGMPAKVTVLYPFVRGSDATDRLFTSLQAIAAQVAAFDFSLTGVGRFPDVVYLRPEPADPFVALTRAVHERWPAHPPYGGRFEGIVPHVTVADGPSAGTDAAELEAVLPLHDRAKELVLFGETLRGRWRVLGRVPLRG